MNLSMGVWKKGKELMQVQSTKVNIMDFGQALTLLKNGKKVSRGRWKEKEIWIDLKSPDKINNSTLPILFLNYPDGEDGPWILSQADVLAEDWQEAAFETNDAGRVASNAGLGPLPEPGIDGVLGIGDENDKL